MVTGQGHSVFVNHQIAEDLKAAEVREGPQRKRLISQELKPWPHLRPRRWAGCVAL